MFKGAGSFNQALGRWEVDNVQTMGYMFRSATSFNQDLSDWRLNSVTSMIHMFYHSSAFDQDLGWCVDDDVNLEEAFSNTPCASTSCGVGVKGVSCALPSPAPTVTQAPTNAPSPAPTVTAAPTVLDCDRVAHLGPVMNDTSLRQAAATAHSPEEAHQVSARSPLPGGIS